MASTVWRRSASTLRTTFGAGVFGGLSAELQSGKTRGSNQTLAGTVAFALLAVSRHY
jgi:hypothetical protein